MMATGISSNSNNRKPSLEVTDDILRAMKVDPAKRATLKKDDKAAPATK